MDKFRLLFEEEIDDIDAECQKWGLKIERLATLYFHITRYRQIRISRLLQTIRLTSVKNLMLYIRVLSKFEDVYLDYTKSDRVFYLPGDIVKLCRNRRIPLSTWVRAETTLSKFSTTIETYYWFEDELSFWNSLYNIDRFDPPYQMGRLKSKYRGYLIRSGFRNPDDLLRTAQDVVMRYLGLHRPFFSRAMPSIPASASSTRHLRRT